MLKSSTWRGEIREAGFPVLAVFLAVAGLIALLVAGLYGVLDPLYGVIAIGAIIMAIAVILHQDALAATLVVATHLYVDWYLGYEVIGVVIALGLLLTLFLSRAPKSLQYSWASPGALWLWALFLGLTISPAIQGAITRHDALYYYPNIIFGALIFFWLGMIVARNKAHLHNLFKLLSGLGALLAIHMLIQVTTGITLFGTGHESTYLIEASSDLSGSSIQRFGSFFINPDWNGTFFAMMLFLPLGLFVESTSFLERLLYIVEIFLIVAALLSTYSIGGWVGAFVGILVFMLFVGHSRYRIFIFFALGIVAAVVAVIFPTQVNLQFQHLASPIELSLRSGAWQTAIGVIVAFPWTGVGLGLNAYLQRAEPYRVPAQLVPLAHPHNSYLELGAMAGLPVLLVFVFILLFALWQAWRNWIQVDRGVRTLIGGGLATVLALSVNSLSINAWTLPPLAALGWLILGAIASPLIVKNQSTGLVKEKNS